MSGSTPYDELNRWLDRATHGLPPHLASGVRAELAAHVEDAAADFVRQGVPQPEAERRALAALGDPQPAAHGFNDVHRGRRCYTAALAASVATLALQIGFPGLYAALDVADFSTASRLLFIANHALQAALMVYVIVAFRRLLAWRFDNRTVTTPCRLMFGGLGMYLAANGIAELTIDAWDPVPTALRAANAVEGAVLAVMHGGLLVLSAGLFWFGRRALPTPNGLVKGAAALGSIEAATMILTLSLLYLDRAPFAAIFGALNVLVGLFLWPAISLVFFQASATSRRLPTRTA